MIASKNAIFFILITICIDSIGLGIIIPSLPTLIAETVGVSQNESSWHAIWITIAFAGTQFLFAPVVGNLSDRFGRRPILMLSLAGLAIDYVFMYFAPTFGWLVVGRIISGMFGASFTTAAAYIADISDDDTRARNFGLIGAAFGIGFIVGPAIGGLVSDLGSRAPFLVAAFLSGVNLLYGMFVLKESLPADQRRKFEWKRANPLGAILQLHRFGFLKYAFIVVLFLLLSNSAVHSVWNYYTHARFGWTPKIVGISLMMVGICFGVIQGGLSGLIIKKLGEQKTAIYGLLLDMLVVLLIGLSTQGWMLFALILPYALAGLVDPALRSILSSKTKNNEQGELQGIFTSLMSIAEIIGPAIMLWVFYKTAPMGEKDPFWFGTPFFLGGIFALIALILMIWIFRKTRNAEVIYPLKEGEILDDSAKEELLTD